MAHYLKEPCVYCRYNGFVWASILFPWEYACNLLIKFVNNNALAFLVPLSRLIYVTVFDLATEFKKDIINIYFAVKDKVGILMINYF